MYGRETFLHGLIIFVPAFIVRARNPLSMVLAIQRSPPGNHDVDMAGCVQVRPRNGKGDP
jgi:hypothetical protein